MRQWKIVTKIVVTACGIVFLLLSLGLAMLVNFEFTLLKTFKEEQLANLVRSMDERQQAETALLREEILFNAQILGEISAEHLYNVDPDGIVQPLQSYMNYPEIMAIQVFDEDKNSFAAIWKTPEIRLGERLPESLSLGEQRVVKVEAIYEQQKVGEVSVYYIDTMIEEKLRQAKEKDAARIEQVHATVRASLQQSILHQGGGMLIIIVILIFCLMLVLRALVLKPISTIVMIAHSLAELDLTVSINATQQDEIGKLLTAINEMVQSFRKVVGQVQRSGIQVTSSSTELAATAKQQEVTIRTQMDSIHQMVRAIQDISDVMVELDNTVQKVAEMSEETAEFASSGQVDLSRMEEAMAHMEQASQSISGRLGAINEKAENITTVVTTITKVADQTNLLSLNASIEAEKAGEYGRGFIVVAREIRRLADQTAVATLDIEQMVQEMQSAVSAGVMEMDKFITEVRQSAEDVEKISMQLTRIIEQVQALSPSFEDVNEAMQFQSQNTRQINATIVRLSEEMQQTTESLRESFLAIEQLNEAARGLQEEVSRFKVEE